MTAWLGQEHRYFRLPSSDFPCACLCRLAWLLRGTTTACLCWLICLTLLTPHVAAQRDYYRLLEMGHLREALLKEGVEEARTMKTLNVQMNLRKVSNSG